MKVNLVFSLPEESEEHEAALNGPKYSRALNEFTQTCRKLIKHEGFAREFQDWIERKRKDGEYHEDTALSGFKYAVEMVYDHIADESIRG